MRIDEVEDSEEFWIDVVEGSVHEGEHIICVPLAGLSRKTAATLATRLDITVFIKGNDYLFTTSQQGLQELLQDDRVLH